MRAFSKLSILIWVTFESLWSSFPPFLCLVFAIVLVLLCLYRAVPGHIRMERLCPDRAHLLTLNSAYWVGRR
jgi:hypothetical protein